MKGPVTSGQEELLQAVGEEDKATFVRLIQRHNAKSDTFDIGEVLAALSNKQLSEVWSNIQMTVTTALLSPNLEATGEEQDLKEVATYLHCVLTVAMATISMKNPSVPTELHGTAVVLHGFLPTLPAEHDSLKNYVAQLCEMWWHKDLPGKADLASQTLLYLLERSLRIKASAGDVKRVWKMHDVLGIIDLNNSSADTMKNMVLVAYITSVYLMNDDGIKFLAFALDVNADFINQIHETIKRNLPASSKRVQTAYGKIYFKAWKIAAGPILGKLENNCIQDLMHAAVLAHRSGPHALFPQISRVLNHFHSQDKQRGVSEMLIRLYEPILWRYLKVANPHVRTNAAALLLDAFPLQDSEADITKRDQIMQKQFDAFSMLLEDACPQVRALAAYGICQIIQIYWELIPGQTIKAFVGKLVQELAWDMNSADTRLAVVKGLNCLLDQHLSHPLLKAILPEMKNMFHDMAEKVRVAFCNLLLKVKQLHTIKYWSIVPIERIMAAIEMDAPAVSQRLVQLLFSSCFPENKPLDEVLGRCLDLIEKYPASVRRFYRYAVKHMSFSTAMKFIVTICKAIRRAVHKAAKKQQGQSPSVDVTDDFLESFGEEDKENSQDTEEDENEDDEELLTVNRTDVIASLLEIAVILWSANAHVLNKPVNQRALQELQKCYSIALPQFFKAFQDPKILDALTTIAGFLPPAAIPTFSRSTLSKLKHMTVQSTVEEYGPIIQSMCKWGRLTDIAELAWEWIEAGLKTEGTPSAQKNPKQKRGVAFAEPVEPQPILALQYIGYITKQTACREALLGQNRDAARQLTNDMKTVLYCIEQRVTSGELLGELGTDEFLLQTLETYLKLEILLHNEEDPDTSASRKMDIVLGWTDRILISTIKKSSQEKPQRKARKLMRKADATLLASATDGLNFDGSQTLMSETLSDTMYAHKRVVEDAGERGRLAEKVLECVLTISGDVLLIGVADERLASKMADLITKLLGLDGITEQFPHIFKVMHQIIEFALHMDLQGLELDSVGTAFQNPEFVPNLLQRMMTVLAKFVVNKPAQAERILPFLKPVVTEMMTSYFTQAPDPNISTGLIGSIVTGVLTEMTQVIKKDNQFEACHSLVTLPMLSAFVLTVITRTSAVPGLFLGEVCANVESSAPPSMEFLLGATHLIHALTATRGKLNINEQLKECTTVLCKALDTFAVEDDVPENCPLRGMQRMAHSILADCTCALDVQA